MSSSSHEAARWERLSSRQIATTRVLDVEGVRFHHPVRKTEKEFVVLKAPDWVNVIAVTPENDMVLVRQFRYGMNDFSLEIPGGVMEKGEDPVAAGVRELREETGYSGSRASLMASVHANPAIQSNRCHFVLVEDAARNHDIAWDHDEEMDLKLVPVPEVLTLAREGKITHSLVVAAFMHFEGVWRQRGKL